ncbi:MAG TPA: tetratricopeptide repeat protein [Xanthobacteraceae bacterium]|nr:tetratricopeptide repeat protein [Xanthobacteraceae bacterium]
MNVTDQQTLQRAMAALKAGALADAERGFAEFLRRYPKDSGVLSLYGTLLAHMGRWAEAERALRRAIKAGAASDATFYNYGLVLRELGRPQDAYEAFSRAIALNPGVPETWNNRGTVLNALNRGREAVNDFMQAVRLNPRYAEAHYNAARALADIKEFDGALTAYDAALRIRPDFADALVNRGLLLLERERHEEALATFERAIAVDPRSLLAQRGRGIALHKLERLDEARAALETALRLRPDDTDTLIVCGVVLHELKLYQEALASFEQVLAREPGNVQAWNGRGGTLQALDRFEEALQSYDRAIALEPASAEAHYGRAAVLFATEQLADALTCVERALESDPSLPKAHWVKSQLLLAMGRFEAGWDLHEHRFTMKSGKTHRLHYPHPRWTGAPLDGVLLVWGEQGLGEHIMHAGAIEEARARAGKLVFEVEPRLVPLFARSFPEVEVVAAKPAPGLYEGHIDAHAPVVDLSRYLRRSFEAFPRRERGYLVADPARAAELRRRLHDGRYIIGLSWVSRNQFTGASKSAQLADLAPVLRLAGCRFIDLQYGDTSSEREQVARELGFVVERLADIDNMQDIDGLAALMMACDAVVAVSNTNAHLAGALGVPTWVMVPHGHVGFWYWFRGKDFSPWYPRVRVLRRDIGQPWSELAQATADEIRAYLDRG